MRLAPAARRLIGLPAGVIDRVREAAGSVAGAVAAFIVPSSAEESAVLVGMVLLSAWALVADYIPDDLAIGIPGVVYLLTGLGFSLRRGR